MADKDTTFALDVFAKKASAALRRKTKYKTFTVEFKSFAKDGDGEPLAIKFKTLSDAEINDCIAYDSDSAQDSDKYAMYISAVEPSLKELGKKLKEAGEITVPLQVVDMFERHEITEAATLIMQESGLLSKEKDQAKIIERSLDNLKN